MSKKYNLFGKRNKNYQTTKKVDFDIWLLNAVEDIKLVTVYFLLSNRSSYTPLSYLRLAVHGLRASATKRRHGAADCISRTF